MLQLRDPHADPAGHLQARGNCVLRRPEEHRVEALGVAGAEPLPLGRRRLHHDASADRGHGRVRADDEAVARPGDDGFFQPQLRPADLAGSDPRLAQERDSPQDLRGPEVESDPLPRPDLPRRIREDTELHGKHPARRPGAVADEHVAARDLRAFHARERDGDAAPRLCALDLRAVDVEPANPGAPARRQQPHRRLTLDPAAPECPRDHRAGASNGEDAIDREPDQVVGAPLGDRRRGACQRRA